MQTLSRSPFTTVKTEGGILPADLLSRVAGAQIDGLKPTDYHLAPTERLNEAISRSWNRLLGVWRSFDDQRRALVEADRGTTLTRERWLLILFQELGYGRLQFVGKVQLSTDSARSPLPAFPSTESYPISHLWEQTPIHLVSFRQDLDRRDPAVGRSPHSLLQEYLNRSDEALWGFTSNGLRLRALRDNASLTRAAYVEFDLEAMMAGELYSDFSLLWLVCHQSRVERTSGSEKTGAKSDEELSLSDSHPLTAADCWLERWSQSAAEQGARALDALRDGVQEAIGALGKGFLDHKANRQLRVDLQAGRLSTYDYYRQLLRLVYRLIFLFVAEDRDLLMLPDAPAQARRRYRAYSVSRLRDLATARRGTAHPDLYRSLRLPMVLLRAGYEPLGLPGLGGFLFSDRSTPDLDAADLANRDLLDAIRALAFAVDNSVRRPVDYRNLDTEELGSVYESLLELHPQLNVDAAIFALEVVAGSERKTTGTHYTPTPLVNNLLDTALEPVVADRLKAAEERWSLGNDRSLDALRRMREAALLSIKVLDYACGSGHMLIGAGRRLARHLAHIRTGDEEPSPEAIRAAMRDVVSHCLYGVDINEMAVELCKVALWMETLEPGKPLTFLDKNIQCGNSLIGVTPALLEKGIPDEAFLPIEGDDRAYCQEWKRRNKEQRAGQMSLFSHDLQPWDRLGALATAMAQMEATGDDTLAGVQRQEAMYEQLVRSSDYRYGRLLADAWCAAFVWKKTKEFAYPITEEIFRRIEHNPFDVAPWMVEEIERLRAQYQFFHWHLAFPQVFTMPAHGLAPDNEQMGWNGGFDVVLSNSPWEMPETDDRVFFELHRPEIASEASAHKRHQMITELAKDDRALFGLWTEYVRRNVAQRTFFSVSGRYPNSGIGRLNYHRLFAENAWNLVDNRGLAGVIVPSGIATNKYEELIWHHFLESSGIASIFDFENRRQLFPAVDSRMKFCLLTLTKAPNRTMRVGCWLTGVTDLKQPGRVIEITVQDLRAFDPETLALPQFRGVRDLNLLKDAHKAWARFSSSPGWEHTLRLMFSSSDRDFLPVESSESAGWPLLNSNRKESPSGQRFVPVYEGKMVGLFDHRAADVYLNPSNLSRQAQKDVISTLEKANPLRFAEPQFWLDEDMVRKKRLNKDQGDWMFAFCDVTSATNERTSIPALIPLAGLTRSMPAIYLLSPNGADATRLLSVLSSFALDFYVRLKVSTNHLTQGIMESLPIPQLQDFAVLERNLGSEQWISHRVLELIYTAWDLQPFAHDCGYDGPPFRWNEDRRFLLRCELDAAYFHLYGIARDDVDYIMETFPIVKRKDVAAHGEYRTKRVILEIYDAMQQAMDTGEPYKTRLDPPPADPRVAHEGEPPEWAM